MSTRKGHIERIWSTRVTFSKDNLILLAQREFQNLYTVLFLWLEKIYRGKMKNLSISRLTSAEILKTTFYRINVKNFHKKNLFSELHKVIEENCQKLNFKIGKKDFLNIKKEKSRKNSFIYKVKFKMKWDCFMLLFFVTIYVTIF